MTGEMRGAHRFGVMCSLISAMSATSKAFPRDIRRCHLEKSKRRLLLALVLSQTVPASFCSSPFAFSLSLSPSLLPCLSRRLFLSLFRARAVCLSPAKP